jgi:peptidoglycan/LPS O-acetylase OafA/YrhL
MSEAQVTRYRKDIQGLRGVAILLVLIYHSGMALPGGFVGVDVFFVVSGFVITQLLVEELELTGGIDLRNFYARRARRLLPALAIVTVSTLAFSFVALSPFGAQQEVVATGAASSVFIANFYLLIQDTYSNLGSNPLRHMWSLAVEEQFYLVFPVVIFLAWKILLKKTRNPKRNLSVLVVSAGMVSFYLSYGFSNGRGARFVARLFETTPERFAFFSMPTRAWEFALGVLVFLGFRSRNRFNAKLALIFTAIAFSVLIWSATFIRSEDSFPGWRALLPTTSTALLILFGTNSKFNEILLGNRFICFLGDISYGLYLWHWPFVVFADVLWPSSQLTKPLATVLALIPTLLMYRFIESPIRFNTRITGTRAVGLTATCLLFPLLLTSVSGDITKRVESFFSEQKLGWGERRLAVINGCYGNIYEDWSEENCSETVSESAKMVLLLGDSQAASASDGVVVAAKSLGLNVAYFAYPGCPMFSRAPRDSVVCGQVIDFQLSLLNELNPELVVIANAGFRYTWNGLEVARSEISGGGFPDSISEKEIAVGESYAEIVEKILEDGHKVIIISEPPQVQFSKQISLLSQSSRVLAKNASAQSSRIEINEYLNSRFAGNDQVSIVQSDDILCPTGVCYPKLDGKWIYMENSHLNPDGSRLLAPRIETAMKTQLKIGD